MTYLALCFFLLTNIAFAEVGNISKVSSKSGSYIIRGKDKKSLTSNLKLEEGDQIFSQRGNVTLKLSNLAQISLKKDTVIKVNQPSQITFVKGLVIVNNQKSDFKVDADGVMFVDQGSHYAVSKVKENFELDVMKGEVIVSSPFVQTFVPEVVKANEGFRFDKKAHTFERRKYKARK